MNIRYRLRQFARALRGPSSPPDLGDLSALLTAPQRALFVAMAPVDQDHCLSVARVLAASGQAHPDLLCAALLHDCGKALARIMVWERVAYVLLGRLAPTWVGRLGSAQAGGFGHGLYLLAHHARLGAALAAQAGCSPATVALIAGVGDPAMQESLRRADDAH
jgi:hypothetical protein